MKLFSFFKTPIIEFLCEPQDVGVLPLPVTANKMMPKWFKQITPLVNSTDHFGGKAMSAKKCQPLIDAMTLGFIIPLWADMNVRTSKDGSLIDAQLEVPSGHVCQYHSNEQLGGPKNSPTGKAPAIKFINRWVIKTAPGWSTLFIPPINHMDERFTCLGGLVDTDKYPKQVNFPAVWHLPDFDGVIKAGTPLVTAIPIYRGSQPDKVLSRALSDEEQAEVDRIARCQGSRSGVYTHELREKR